MPARRSQIIISRQRLAQLATASILLGLLATLLSGFIRTQNRRIIELAEGFYLDGSWLGWPIQYIYQTDVFQPDSISSDQAVDGFLLGLNWLTWTLLIMSTTLIVMVARTFYAGARN